MTPRAVAPPTVPSDYAVPSVDSKHCVHAWVKLE